tara:strand:- start:485 stop:2950 length:2466 start_codon:yes stop_codon:yes gene_type:complete
MPSRFEKFSERARKVLAIAQEEAQRFNHSYIGTEHILLGISREPEGIASRVLEVLGIDGKRIRTAVEFIVSQDENPKREDVGLTDRAKKVIELAVDEARKLNHHYIGTEHILIGILREGDGVAAGVLENLGASLEDVRIESEKILSENVSSHITSTSKNKSNTPLIDELGTDLTELARNTKLDPVIGREDEMKRVIQILCRRTKNNPVLIGEPGVGKTAIVEKLAQNICDQNVPELIISKRVITLDIGSLVAGTKYRGEFEDRLKKIIKELKQSKDCIVFIDEMHTIVGAGAAEGAVDAANILKPALARGEIQIIGATTISDYRKNVEKDPALERRFQPVKVDPPSVDSTIDILLGVRSKYEDHHGLVISDQAIKTASLLADKYIADRFMPDKAIDLIDEAGSRVKIDKNTIPETLRKATEKLDEIKIKKEKAMREQDYEVAAELRDEEIKQESRTLKLKDNWEKSVGDSIEVTPDDIAEVVSMWTKIPVTRLGTEEKKRLLDMEESLTSKVSGQKDAIHSISTAVRRARSGIKDPSRPIGCFLFLGPTGVGKTHLVKKLSEFMYGAEDKMIRLDMSEYMERHTVARLIGSPPGYVGFEDGGQLTEAVRRNSYTTILLDEIEKAHPDVFNILLQIFEDGFLTDSKGRKVDFKNTLIVMTSNLGSDLIRDDSSLGFSNSSPETVKDDKYSKMKTKVLDEVKRFFKPEFLNRIDDVQVFHPLAKENILEIVDLLLNELQSRVLDNGYVLQVSDSVRNYLVDNGYDPKFGARPLRRLIQDEIENILSEEFLKDSYMPGDIIELSIVDNKIQINQDSKVESNKDA